MKFPNKFVTYKNSILYKLPKVLEKLEDCDLSVKELYNKTKKETANIQEFVEILDCLYMIGKIELKEEIVHYVKGN